MSLYSGVSSVCSGWMWVGVYVGLPSANVTSFAPVPLVTAAVDCGNGGDVVVAVSSVVFKLLSLLFNHTMRMMMIRMTTSSTASNDTTTPATIPADDPLVVLSPDP